MPLCWPSEGVTFVVHCFVLLLDLIRFISNLLVACVDFKMVLSNNHRSYHNHPAKYDYSRTVQYLRDFVSQNTKRARAMLHVCQYR